MSLKPEQIAHINIVNWFNHNFPELEKDFHHFANERKCSVIEGRILKRMGVQKGVADFHLGLGQKHYFGMWLELKVGKNKLTKEQSEFLARKHDRGYYTAVAYEEDQAKDIILYYLEEYNTNSNIVKLKNGTNN